MKYLLTTLVVFNLMNVSFASGHDHGGSIAENCLNKGFGKLIYDDKDIIENGVSYFTANGSVTCQVKGLEMMATRKASSKGGNCALTQISKEKVEMKFDFDYKIPSSVDLSKESSLFDDAYDCFVKALK